MVLYPRSNFLEPTVKTDTNQASFKPVTSRRFMWTQLSQIRFPGPLVVFLLFKGGFNVSSDKFEGHISSYGIDFDNI